MRKLVNITCWVDNSPPFLVTLFSDVQSVFLPASLLAAKTGGMALVSGMAVFAGLLNFDH